VVYLLACSPLFSETHIYRVTNLDLKMLHAREGLTSHTEVYTTFHTRALVFYMVAGKKYGII